MQTIDLGIEDGVVGGASFDVVGIDEEVGEELGLVLLDGGGGIVVEEAGEAVGEDGGFLQVLGVASAVAVAEVGRVEGGPVRVLVEAAVVEIVDDVEELVVDDLAEVGGVVGAASDVEVEGVVLEVGDGVASLAGEREVGAEDDALKPGTADEVGGVERELGDEEAGVGEEVGLGGGRAVDLAVGGLDGEVEVGGGDLEVVGGGELSEVRGGRLGLSAPEREADQEADDQGHGGSSKGRRGETSTVPGSSMIAEV